MITSKVLMSIAFFVMSFTKYFDNLGVFRQEAAEFIGGYS